MQIHPQQPDQQLTHLFHDQMNLLGLRVTANRLAIFQVLAKADQPQSIQEIVQQTAVGSGHFTSIYRSVDVLTKAGILRHVPRGFKSLYELGETFRSHHHHLTCENCGQTIGLHSNRLESLMQELTIQAGFTPTNHHFELFGICPDCQIGQMPE